MADKKQQEVKVGSKSYEARAKTFDTKVPGATPFQDKLKDYELKAPTIGMFGGISKDGESILEIAAWKRADEYCTFFASKPQVALSRIKQQMHREVGQQHAPTRAEYTGQNGVFGTAGWWDAPTVLGDTAQWTGTGGRSRR